MKIAQLLIAVDSVAWAPVVVPSDSASGTVLNAKTIIFDNNESGAQDINRRIVSDDAETQKLIPVGMQGVWKLSDDSRGMSGFSAAQTGNTIAYLRSVSGSFNVAVEFIG
jgi:hypothetical protein